MATGVTVNLPCKVGDYMWAIRKFGTTATVQGGRVSEIYFGENMRLGISIKGVSRGEYGKTVFDSYEDAERVLSELLKGMKDK